MFCDVGECNCRICGGTSSFRVTADEDDDVGNGSAAVLLLLLQYHKNKPTEAMSTTEPTTIPAIAPVGMCDDFAEPPLVAGDVGALFPEVNEGVYVI